MFEKFYSINQYSKKMYCVPCTCTSIATSGQVIAQILQPIHWCGNATDEKKYPLRLKSFDICRTFCGHASTQSSQPLHNSLLIFTVGISCSCFFRMQYTIIGLQVKKIPAILFRKRSNKVILYVLRGII